MNDKKKYSSDWINKLESKEHWLSYWHQLKLMLESLEAKDSMIELGIGSGFTSNYLRSKNIDVLTVDIDKNKSPDIVSDAISFKPNKNYDHFCAFEVFEHMKFEEMENVLKNIKSKIDKNIFISVPIYKKTPINIELKFKSYWKSITVKTPKTSIIDPHHQWELNYKDITEEKLISVFEHHNFKLKNKSSFFRWRYFHFNKTD
tara:strand:+ start:463 stop:1071 length:609 start_codon:yes stop_codon:yes gene_type:complete